jgi:hypothetical protein
MEAVMDVQTVRDVVVVVAGIVWLVVALALAVVFGGAWWLSRRAFRAANEAFPERVRPALAAAHAQLAALRDRTARLPGNVPLPEASTQQPVRPRRPRWPFRRRRRLPFLR